MFDYISGNENKILAFIIASALIIGAIFSNKSKNENENENHFTYTLIISSYYFTTYLLTGKSMLSIIPLIAIFVIAVKYLYNQEIIKKLNSKILSIPLHKIIVSLLTILATTIAAKASYSFIQHHTGVSPSSFQETSIIALSSIYLLIPIPLLAAAYSFPAIFYISAVKNLPLKDMTTILACVSASYLIPGNIQGIAISTPQTKYLLMRVFVSSGFYTYEQDFCQNIDYKKFKKYKFSFISEDKIIFAIPHKNSYTFLKRQCIIDFNKKL